LNIRPKSANNRDLRPLTDADACEFQRLRLQGLKERHIAFIRSLYVAPQARGQGAGQQLLAAALQQAWSWQGVEQVTLSVTASNEAAVRLYKAAGFMAVGRMPRALKMGPNCFDELMMVHRAARS
jgi:ribosomal protein S18 acetylase RimI-like enzyme